MLSIRQRKSVVDKKITVEIPESFGDEVEIIILSNLSNADDKKNIYGKSTLQNTEDKIWSDLTVKEFLSGYSSNDSIYDNIK